MVAGLMLTFDSGTTTLEGVFTWMSGRRMLHRGDGIQRRKRGWGVGGGVTGSEREELSLGYEGVGQDQSSFPAYHATGL